MSRRKIDISTSALIRVALNRAVWVVPTAYEILCKHCYLSG